MRGTATTGRVVVASHLCPIQLERSSDGTWSARWDEDVNRVCAAGVVPRTSAARCPPSSFLCPSLIADAHLWRRFAFPQLETAISRYTALGVRNQPGECVFIGSPNIFVPRSERDLVDAAIERAGLNCILVHLDPSTASRFYQGFCKATLWPLLHNVLDVYNTSAMGAIIDRDDDGSKTPLPATSPEAPEGEESVATPREGRSEGSESSSSE